VVIFQENVSFDHYFGTYPRVTNSSGQPFYGGGHSGSVNNLINTAGVGGKGDLLTNNPNRDAAGKQVNPRARSCQYQRHSHLRPGPWVCGRTAGLPWFGRREDGRDGPVHHERRHRQWNNPTGQPCQASDVMNYYDGNTVAGLWNYASQFAMSDNSFGTTFGPSSPGAINLAAGTTEGVDKMINGADTDGDTVPDGTGGRTLIDDAQPYYDDCSTRDAASLSGRNIGDNLNAGGLSWGWFQGGFRPSTSFATATGGTQPTSTFIPNQFKGKLAVKPASDQGLCNTVHPVGVAVGGVGGTAAGANNYGNKDDYIPHHEPFQYYASTTNRHHLPPASLAAIGTDTQTTIGGVPQFDKANHQYEMSDFNALVGAIAHGYLSPDHLPAVSFLKAPGYQDGHADYSDPLDEQQFIANEINALQHTPDWSSTAVIIAYDDSDGWYDHTYSGIHNPSNTSTVADPPGPQDFLTSAGLCGNTAAQAPLAGQQGRCGFGPRLPLLVISPWAKHNYVDHTLTTQSSILTLIEDNWSLPRIAGSFDAISGTLKNLFDFHSSHGSNSKLYLDPVTGERLGR
jgi:phospholipase C